MTKPEDMSMKELIDARAEVMRELTIINNEAKEKRELQDAIDIQIMIKLDAEGIKRSATATGSASLSEEIVPEVEDWDAIYDHILKTGDFALLQRRPSATAYRELLQLNQSIPGVRPRTVRRINFRKIG